MSDKQTATALSPDGTGPSLPSTDAEAPAKSEFGQKSSEQGGKVGSKPILQQKWDQMYERLLVFKAKHGHLLVPNRYSEDRSLGAWVSTQRRQYKSFQAGEEVPMNKERASKLESIGFVWSTRDPRHVPWELRYKQLLAYHEVNGDALVPIGYKANPQLSNWVSTQRQEMKLLRDGRPTRLTAERINLLNKVHFVWEAQRGGPKKKNIDRYNGLIGFPSGEASKLPPPPVAPAVAVPSQVKKVNAAILATVQMASPVATGGEIAQDPANSEIASESKSDHSKTHPIEVDETLAARGVQAGTKEKFPGANELCDRDKNNEVSACVASEKNQIEKGGTSDEKRQLVNTKDEPKKPPEKSAAGSKTSRECETEEGTSAAPLEILEQGGKRDAATEIGPCAKKSKKDGQGDIKEEAAVALLAVGQDDA